MEINFDTADCHASLALIVTEIFYRINILSSLNILLKIRK